MSGKISQYTEALSVANDDFFDVSIDTGGGVYATRKVRKSNLGIGGNFADSDLTFTGNRSHDLAGFNITLDDASNTSKFSMTVPNIGSGNREIFTIQDRVANSGYFFSKGGTQFEFTIRTSGTNKIKLNGNGDGNLAVGTSVSLGGGSSDQAYLLNDHLTLGGTNSSFNGRFGVRGMSMFTGTTSGAFSETALATVHARGIGSTSATKTALFQNSLGNDSLRVGDDGSVWNARASFSTSFGFEALLNETGGQNTSFGHQALKSATNGIRNVAIGYQALNGSTFAGSNTAVGHEAGLIATGSNNVFMGRSAGSVVTSKDQVTCIGAVSGAGGVGDYSTTLGWNSAGAGVGSTAIGSEARTSVSYASIINCARGIRTNSTSNSLEVYVDNVGTDPVFKVAQSSDSFYAGSGSFGFGTLTPDASSVADMVSTTKGFLPPRMTTTQKNAISTPATGLVVYDSTLNKLCVYTGASWETVTSA